MFLISSCLHSIAIRNCYIMYNVYIYICIYINTHICVYIYIYIYIVFIVQYIPYPWSPLAEHIRGKHELGEKVSDPLKTDYCESICQGCVHWSITKVSGSKTSWYWIAMYGVLRSSLIRRWCWSKGVCHKCTGYEQHSIMNICNAVWMAIHDCHIANTSIPALFDTHASAYLVAVVSALVESSLLWV